mgnify:CR=1 FL=1
MKKKKIFLLPLCALSLSLLAAGCKASSEGDIPQTTEESMVSPAAPAPRSLCSFFGSQDAH